MYVQIKGGIAMNDFEKESKKFSNFIVVWIGQFVSILGSGLSSFGLSVWIFYSTGAATPFAISFLCTMLPTIIFAPFAGSFADRKNRKRTIVISDSLDACLKVIMAVFLFTDVMKIWMVYPILFLSSTLSAFQGPAFSASIPMIVEENKISKANGLLQLNQAVQSMIAPVLAGALYSYIGLKGLLIIDFITFFVAIMTIAITTIPQESVESEPNTYKKTSFSFVFDDFKQAWNCLANTKKLLSAIIIFSVLNFIANLCMILLGPMVLSNYDSTVYGSVQTVSGMSMLIGGTVASLLPDVKNKFQVMFLSLILSGVGLFIAGLNANWIYISVGMFVFYLMVPYANSLFQTVLQTSIASTMLGRVGALVNALLKIVSPIACMLAGPLSDYVFGPLMEEDGKLGRSWIGKVIGSGQGRGDGFIFIVCGILLAAICTLMLTKLSFEKKQNI